MDRADRLRGCIDALFSVRTRPPNLHVHVHAGEGFEQVYTAALRNHPRNAPVFALVDPFGWNGIPMSAMRDLMDRASGEVLVNFMFEEINRFLAHPDQTKNFDVLFGCGDWRGLTTLPPAHRKAGIRDLYSRQLATMAGARYVRYFEMRNGRERTDYYLFFATKNQKGLKKMKEAMWSVDQRGGMTFSDATDRTNGCCSTDGTRPNWKASCRAVSPARWRMSTRWSVSSSRRPLSERPITRASSRTWKPAPRPRSVWRFVARGGGRGLIRRGRASGSCRR